MFLMGAAGAAEASPRDDMLAGISRCAAIADDRVYLDCVYGAAQPMRAELGLPPAPQAQVRLVPGSAQPPANVAMAPAPTPARPQPQPRGVNSIFGSTVVTQSQAMKAYSISPAGLFTVTLSNGQVWRQVAGDFNQAHWNKAASNYVALVETGPAGSFSMEVTGEVGLYKVERVR